MRWDGSKGTNLCFSFEDDQEHHEDVQVKNKEITQKRKENKSGQSIGFGMDQKVQKLCFSFEDEQEHHEDIQVKNKEIPQYEEIRKGGEEKKETLHHNKNIIRMLKPWQGGGRWGKEEESGGGRRRSGGRSQKEKKR